MNTLVVLMWLRWPVFQDGPVGLRAGPYPVNWGRTEESLPRLTVTELEGAANTKARRRVQLTAHLHPRPFQADLEPVVAHHRGSSHSERSGRPGPTEANPPGRLLFDFDVNTESPPLVPLRSVSSNTICRSGQLDRGRLLSSYPGSFLSLIIQKPCFISQWLIVFLPSVTQVSVRELKKITE